MAQLHDDRFLNKTDTYRSAHDTLLQAEMELRAKVEEVVALRHNLPLGGAETQTRFSELFAPGEDTLIVYSFMYPEGCNPCPACTSLIDGLITDRVNFAVFAKTPVADFRA